METNDLLTVDDVAKMLHYNPKTVYRKARKGEIPCYPISPKKRLFSRSVIQYWLINKQTGMP